MVNFSHDYYKRDEFDFPIVNCPYLSSNIPESPAYGVFVSQLIRFARVCSKYEVEILCLPQYYIPIDGLCTTFWKIWTTFALPPVLGVDRRYGICSSAGSGP